MIHRINNLTPHIIRVTMETGETVDYPPTGSVARVSSATTVAGYLNGIPVYKYSDSVVKQLPGPTPGEVFIVSSVVAQHCKDRPDLYVPDTSGESLIRTPYGNKYAVRAFLSYYVGDLNEHV